MIPYDDIPEKANLEGQTRLSVVENKGKGWLHEEFLGVKKLFYILVVLMVTGAYAFVKPIELYTEKGYFYCVSRP